MVFGQVGEKNEGKDCILSYCLYSEACISDLLF